MHIAVARFSLVLATLLALTPTPAQATWSIVIADAETREVAVGTVTCLLDYDLLARVPVVVVGQGAAAVQASGDFDGLRRPIIFEHLQLGTPPAEILALLASVTGHQSRQYGIADTRGRTLTFSGTETYAWRGGVVGAAGSLVYAIQGNILAGGCVVPAIEAALLDTPGDIPAKLMAGMQAARTAGGDGRCSCHLAYATACGCPPPDFTKAGHIGGMIVARIGDIDDAFCDAAGCTDGDYFLRINVAFQDEDDLDPVLQLQALFDAWRAGLEGRPDAIQTTATFDPPVIPPNGVSTTTLHVALRDWRGEPVAPGLPAISVTHAPDSDGCSTIGPITDHGDGTFSVEFTAGTQPGRDSFLVTIDDGVRPVTLMPSPHLRYFTLGDLNCDGRFNTLDIEPFVLALVNPAAYAAAYPDCAAGNADLNGDGRVNVFDIEPFVALLANDCNENGVPDDVDIATGTSLDCNGNGIPDECDLAAGTSTDCNDNGIPDECDIAAGTSLDCNANGVPDECDIAIGDSADCNGNGIPDECDIASGFSQDCQPNGIPDECDLAPPTDVPAADDCAAAQLVCTNITYFGTTAGATPDGSATCGDSTGSPDVWYYFEPYGSGMLTVSLCGSSYDTVLSLHSGCPGTTANQLACNDNYCGQASQLTRFVIHGQSYWIRISGHAGAAGEFQLVLSGPACSYSAECNDNGIPDECEPDCNDNGIPDDCDIAAGTSLDENDNGIPDECE